MANKQFNVRQIQKHDTEANWDLTDGFIPLDGELIVYDKDATHDKPRIKIGDGVTDVKNLPFSGGDDIETITLSAEEQAAMNEALGAIATVAVADVGTTYYAQESGGISEANHNRILEAYAAGKNVNIVIQIDDAPFTLTSIAHTADNTSGSLVVSCAAFGRNGSVVMDVRVLFACGYDSPAGEELLEYYAATMVALCVPKKAD